MERLKKTGWKSILLLCALAGILIAAIGIFSLQASAEIHEVRIGSSDISKELKVYDSIKLYDGTVENISGDQSIIAISDLKLDSNYNYYYLIRASKPGTVTLTVSKKYSYPSTQVKLTIHVGTIGINSCQISGLANKIFTGAAQTQQLTITYEGKQVSYKATYSDDCIAPGTHYVDIEGSGNFSGTKRLSFNINMPQTAIQSVVQGTTALKPTLEKKTGDIYYQLQAKVAGGNYVTYNLKKETAKLFSNLKPGTKMVFRARTYTVIDGKTVFGNWSAPVQKAAGVSIEKCKISGVANKVYNGKNQAQKISVTYKGKRATFKLKYDNNKSIGLRSVTIIGTGVYTDSVTKYYYIIPQTPKITGFVDSYDVFDDFYATLKYTAVAGGVSGYQIAVKRAGGRWEFDTTKNTKYYYRYVDYDSIYCAIVRAYKVMPNGTIIYSKWSPMERVFTGYQYLYNYWFYYTDNTIRGYAKNVLKGEKITVSVGGKTYSTVVTRDAKVYNYKIKIGYKNVGSKIILRYYNKLNQRIIMYNDIVYYTEKIYQGYTMAQVKLCPGFGKPTRINRSAYGESWYYDWGSSSYGWVYFDEYGRVEDWSIYG
ncbi:MAG: hypothetical protein IJJ41_03540 [Clostridia bacterium]|nr:hypothetical protein [Clostridia bacterium]